MDVAVDLVGGLFGESAEEQSGQSGEEADRERCEACQECEEEPVEEEAGRILRSLGFR